MREPNYTGNQCDAGEMKQCGDAVGKTGPDPRDRVKELEALLKRLEYVFHTGMGGPNVNPLQESYDKQCRYAEQLEKENALLRWKLNRFRELVDQ